MRTLNKILLFSLITCLAGCANFPFPGMYKMNVQQGNIMSTELVNDIHVGMSNDQVLAIMGSPVLTDVFNSQQFDYVYTYEHRDYPLTIQRVIIRFTNGRVSSVVRYGV